MSRLSKEREAEIRGHRYFCDPKSSFAIADLQRELDATRADLAELGNTLRPVAECFYPGTLPDEYSQEFTIRMNVREIRNLCAILRRLETR